MRRRHGHRVVGVRARHQQAGGKNGGREDKVGGILRVVALVCVGSFGPGERGVLARAGQQGIRRAGGGA